MLTVALQQSINGVVFGSLYVLVALGLTLIYGVLVQINFAHADIVTIGQHAFVGVWAYAFYAFAALMGVDQPKVSALLNGRLANFSSERLMRLLTALGQDIEITIRPKPRNRALGRIRIMAAAPA